MRRGRLFIYLALILIVGLALVYFYFQSRGGLSSQGPNLSGQQVGIVVAGRDIPRGNLITLEDLSVMNIPVENVIAGEFTDYSQVVGRYSRYPLDQGVPITESVLGLDANPLGESGSSWASLIPPGMTAVSIPISRLTSVGYGIRDGDHVNLIASMLMVDIDANFQSELPNTTAGLLDPGSDAFFVGSGSPDSPAGSFQQVPDTTNLAAQSVSGLNMSQQGRVELDPNFQEPFYIVPSENQRPRLVSQMVLQNILVLHMGTFLLPGETTAATTTSDTDEVQIPKPDLITLVVTPQEAVTLTYLLNSGVQMTMTLRGPSDDVSRVDTEAATLQYLLSQYRIPVPPKLPYSLEPRVNTLVSPAIPR
ncbi:Flp pilus assembly protein CpaB [Chloroflexota bacterium]